MSVIDHILITLGDPHDPVSQSRLIVPEHSSQGDFVLRTCDLASHLRDKDEDCLSRRLGKWDFSGEIRARREGEFVQVFVPLRDMMVAMGRASWLLGADPDHWDKTGPRPIAMPPDDPVSGYRATVLHQAENNLRTLLNAHYVPVPLPADLHPPTAWLDKAQNVIAVMEPETMGQPSAAGHFHSIIKLGLLEIPLSQPVHHAPTTEFNPAVKLHNSLMRSAALLRYGEKHFPSLDHHQFEQQAVDFKEEDAPAHAELRRLAKALLRLAIELPDLAEVSRLPRVLYHLHENARALSAFWASTRILVAGEAPASTRYLHLLRVRQDFLAKVVAALTHSSFQYH